MHIIGTIMNVTLGSEFESRIAKKVKSGLYTSSSEVIRDGLRMLFEKDLIQERKFELLKQQVSHGFEQLKTGDSTDENIMDLFQKVAEDESPYKL